MASAEIIHRNAVPMETTEGDKSIALEIDKTQITGEKCQVSYNSYGHMAVRFIDGESDKLIVFDQQSSREIIQFCKAVFCKGNCISDIPF
ncbi:MAG TPA: hypothetical protein DEF34_03185 [Desulfotomaculum sp.]|nr:MAG: hypothetical protein JL56_02805 [Desulfotomaculum sp. BICA1-6]HBX22631.1 hypothetical protein [Desulfotomaculum sp.]